MRKVILLAVIFALFFIQWMLMPSKLECTGDGPSHASAIWFYGYSLREFLRVPWTNPFFFSGASFSVFYFSLLYAAAGMLSTILNYILALKIITILSYALSVYSMRLLAKEHGLDEKESLIAGLLYAFSNWIVFTTFFRGAYLDVVAYAFLPLPFLFIKRGLDKELLAFVASTALLAVSFQNSLYFLLPAVVIYALICRQKPVHLALWAAAFSALLAFFIVPFALMKGETQIKTALAFQPAIPLNLAIPQWGWFYSEYDKYLPHLAALDSLYFGVLRLVLSFLGMVFFWKKIPGMAFLALYSFAFLIGLFPSLYFSARALFLLNLPLSIFMAFGLRKFLENRHATSIAAFALLANLAGLVVLAKVYLERAGMKAMAVPDLPWLPAMLGFALVVAVLFLMIRKKPKYVPAAIVALLLFEALPNAINPTMVFPTPSQVEPCQYPAGEHEFIANSFCATRCGKTYSYHQGLWHTGSARLTGEYERLSRAGSSCPDELANLGVKYCFSNGRLTELRPAPFVNSTSRYAIERDEPDHLAIRFEMPGHAKVRLGYFGFYRGFSNGKEVELKQSPEGFIEFDHPNGLVEIKVAPPRIFRLSYLLSLVAGLFVVAGLLLRKKCSEAKVLAIAFLPILVHIALRLFAA